MADKQTSKNDFLKGVTKNIDGKFHTPTMIVRDADKKPWYKEAMSPKIIRKGN